MSRVSNWEVIRDYSMPNVNLEAEFFPRWTPMLSGFIDLDINLVLVEMVGVEFVVN